MEPEQFQPDARGLEELARQRFSAGDFNGAVELLGRAIALDPQSPQLRTNLGVVLAAATAADGHVSGTWWVDPGSRLGSAITRSP